VGRVSTLPTVLVARQSDGNFAVRVRNGKALVRASFAFLLDREPASSILPKFSLDVIPRYFPEYRREIQSYL
jgi:hypothetical protein